jgi:hypothetical protein
MSSRRRWDRYRTGRNERIHAIKLSRPVRSQFEALCANGMLDWRHRVHRAGHIPTAPQIRALTNDWDDLLTTRGNPTDV